MTQQEAFSDPRSEAGETLIEVLLASALMALVVVSILGGVATMILGTAVHRDQTEANPKLISAMETLKSSATARLCPASTNPLPAYTFSDTNVSIFKIEYQELLSGTTWTWSSSASACDDTPASGPANTGTPDPDNPMTLQRITLRYNHPDGNVVPELQFVKGNQ
jgi:hypothetical protein